MSDSCKVCKFPTDDIIGVCSDHACMRQYIEWLEAECERLKQVAKDAYIKGSNDCFNSVKETFMIKEQSDG